MLPSLNFHDNISANTLLSGCFPPCSGMQANHTSESSSLWLLVDRDMTPVIITSAMDYWKCLSSLKWYGGKSSLTWNSLFTGSRCACHWQPTSEIMILWFLHKQTNMAVFLIFVVLFLSWTSKSLWYLKTHHRFVTAKHNLSLLSL